AELRKSSPAGVQHPTSNELAGGGARTHTALRPLDFESSASANSATPACRKNATIRSPRRSSSRGNKSRHAILPYTPLFSVATAAVADPDVGVSWGRVGSRGRVAGMGCVLVLA